MMTEADMEQARFAGSNPDRPTYQEAKKKYMTMTGTGTKGRSKRFRGVNKAPAPQEVAAAMGGQLNPSWVEWLMGWPIGWTDLRPLGMDRFRQWLERHGGGSGA
jgi:hypothetical protein